MGRMKNLYIQRAIFYSLMLSLISFGLNYHIGKAFIHLAVFLSVINCIFLVKNKSFSLLLKNEKSIVMTGTLFLSATILLIYYLIFQNPISTKHFSNMFYPILFFAIIIPSLSITNKDKRVVFYSSTICCMTMAASGIIDYININSATYRTAGMLNMPIIYASCLAIITAWISAEFFRRLSKKKWISAALSFAAIGLGITAISFTGSRGPIVASLLVFSGLFLHYIVQDLSRKKLISLAFVLLSASLTASIIAEDSKLIDNLKSRFQQGYSNVTSGFEGGKRQITSSGIRLDMWEASLVAISDHPFIGIGPGNHAQYFQNLDKEKRTNINTNIVVTFGHMHNDFIQSWLSMGLIFGTLSLVFIVYCAVIFVINIKKYNAAIVGSSVAITFILCGLTDVAAHRAASLTFFLLLISIQIARLNNQDIENPELS